MIFNRNAVPDRNSFIKADRAVYELSEQLLVASGARYREQSWRVLKLLPRFDKAFWFPDGSEINTPVGFISNTKGRVYAYFVVHQAMHLLLSQRFGKQLSGMPRFTLLAEGLAGAIELHYALAHIAAGGQPNEEFAFAQYAENATGLNIDLVAKLNQGLKDPFRAFKQNALDSAMISGILFENLVLASKGKGVGLKQIEKTAKSAKQLVFLRHKDFANFILFVKNYCGSRSAKRDARAVEECLRILNASESVFDFMTRLGGKELANQRLSVRRLQRSTKAGRSVV